MEILQVVGLGLMAAVLAALLQEQKMTQFTFLLILLVSVFIFLFLLDKISIVIHLLERLADQAGVQPIFLQTILKVIGIAYIAEFGAQIARDAGQSSIGSRIELAGKVLILVMAVPIITIIVETVMQLLPV